jgi:MFS family permease
MSRPASSSSAVGKASAESSSSLPQNGVPQVPALATTEVEIKGGSDVPAATAASSEHSWRFWLIIIAMCLCAFTSSLDTLIITTALPRVTESIGGQAQYVWIANSFLFASTVVQPLYGQVSNIFGRRMPMLLALALFATGSGIGGGSTSVAMLIAGRTVQGLGTGGIFVMADLIICDLVPLRERAKYMGMVLSTAAVGTAIGPVVGGGLAQASWRWVFYLNLPISIPALIMLFFFLRLKYRREPTWRAALLRVDWLGNAIFIPSVLAVLLGLVMGGTLFPWSSWRIIVPIVLGVCGWILFHLHQASPICREPSVPPRLFANRTSCIGFFLAFDSAMILNWTAYFLPFYFQAGLGASPVRSGVDVLPFNLFMVPAAMVAGGLLAKFGQYKPFHWAGFGLFAISAGLLSTLDSTSGRAAWACFQIIGAIGLGLILTTVLPAILASLSEADAAVATGTFSFLRSLGYTFGVTIPAIIFNGQFDRHSGRISDPVLRATLSRGAAYGYASSGQLADLQEPLLSEVRSVYTDAIRTTWQVALGFALLGFVVVVLERHVALRTELETEFGLDEGDRQKKKGDLEASEAVKVEEVKAAVVESAVVH